MSERDVPGAAEVERLSSLSPWSEAQFRAELANPLARFWVARGASGQVLGYVGLWRVAGEAQLVNLAVRPDHRGQGLGRRLLREALALSRSEGLSPVRLEVRAGNVPALRLYASEGFVETSRRPRFYEGREDAVLMEKVL